MPPRDPRPTPIDVRRPAANAGAARTLRLAGAVAAIGLAVLGDASRGAVQAVPSFTPAQRARILTLGPWPPAGAASGQASVDNAQAARIALGERLFHSARLSGRGGVRCASCHEPFRQFTDGRPRARGLADGARNTPTLLDVARHRVFGWDGARDRLDAQSLRPMREPAEMDASPAHVAALLRTDTDLRAGYVAAFGHAPPADDDAVFDDVGRALAAFEGTLASPRTAFDAWRDALAGGHDDTAALAPAARRGLALFVGRGGCIACHSGALFGDDVLRISSVRAHRPEGATGSGGNAPDVALRTPSLREVAATAPYMHDGSVARLCDAARPHTSGADAVVPHPPLTAGERDDIAAFLAAASADAPQDADTRACADDPA
jgi:cytochrome c peroxidase